MANYTVLSVRILHNETKEQQQHSEHQQSLLPSPPPDDRQHNHQLEQNSGGFTHHSEYCVCRGSGVGCDCGRVCHCADVRKTKCHCGHGCYNSWDRCMLG